MKKFLKYLALCLVIWFLIHLTFIFSVGFASHPKKADAILIFGNKVEETGLPSDRLRSRLDMGLNLYQQEMAPLIVVSGGLGKEGYEEAEIMKDYLVEKGVESAHILVDKEGNNTFLTAKNLSQITNDEKIESVIIVSQYYHLLRARMTLRKFGFDPVYVSRAKMFPEWRDFYSVPREIIGYYSYLFKSYN